VVPRPSGLPSVWVLTVFPAIVLIGLVVLVGLGLTGSSTGFIHQFVSSSSDPDLLAGEPQAIRSDEWFVQTGWTISQVEQGLPATNHTFPGGMDATVQHDLPSTDWSVGFRPHLLGFLVLPLDNAMALKWWLPGFALIIACYIFMVTILPRRPVMAAAVSVGFFFAPFFQWWYLSITFWPPVWAFLVMAAAVWLIRSRALSTKIIWSVVVGYFTVALGTGIYVPFIVPAVLVALAFVVGFVVSKQWAPLEGVWPRLKALLPLIIGGVVGVGVLVVWILTRIKTVELFLGTVYPGQRFQQTGAMTVNETLALLGAPMTEGLGASGGTPLSSNASEAATFFFTGLFLVVPMIWLLVRDRRRNQSTDWLIVCLVLAGALMLAFMFIPGWDAIAHLTLLDRTTTGRIRMGLGILSVIAIAVFIARTDELRSAGNERVPWCVAWLSSFLAAASVGVVTIVLVYLHAPLLFSHKVSFIVITVLYLASVFFLTRGWGAAGAIALLVMSLIGSIGVNPLYEGVFDLNDTAVVKEMKSLETTEPGSWVGVGESFLPNAMLVQSGLPGFNGFQSAPPKKMWSEIDPSGRYERKWNRLANISWRAGTGAPVATNPAPDQIRLTFDSCSAFAQKNVVHVLSDAKLDQPCLTLEKKVVEGPSTLWLYDVAKN
jgi:hypothetical protein